MKKTTISNICMLAGACLITTPAFSAQEKPATTAEALYKELRLLRAEVSAAHLDSLVLLLEKTSEEIESPSSDPSLLDEQIADKEKELQAPSTPAALDKLQKELQELKDSRSANNAKIEKLKRREENIKGRIERQKQKLRQLTKELSSDNEASSDIKLLNETLSE